ncbi:hypothetical protein EIP86_003436 [Pleurotus ostreatoroseus]|nr:hypothetical protein EIP86_003436 [Pleurotus ostreatoroseus]
MESPTVAGSSQPIELYGTKVGQLDSTQPAPLLTTVTRRTYLPSTDEDIQTKRRAEVVSDDESMSPIHKKPRLAGEESDEDDAGSDDEIEVEDLIVDKDGEMNHKKKKAANKQWKDETELWRKRRRELNAARAREQDELQDVSMTDLTVENGEIQSSVLPNSVHNGQPKPTNPVFPSTGTYAAPPPTMPGSWAGSSPPLGVPTDATFTQGSSYGEWSDAAPYTRSEPSYPEPNHEGGFPKENRREANGTTFKRHKLEEESPIGPTAKRLRKAEPIIFTRNRGRSRPPTGPQYRADRMRARFAGTHIDTNVFVEILVDANEDSEPAEAIRQKYPGFEAENDSRHAKAEYMPEEDPISLEEKIRRMREIHEYERERAREMREEAQRRAEEAEREARRRQEEQWAREREKAAREQREREREQARRRREQEEQERKKRQQEEDERRQRQQREARWSTGPWTSLRALERYKCLSEAFDSAQFTLDSPISFLTIPWPVLHRPSKLSVEDIDWQAVEQFFDAVKKHMRSQDYKEFVERSHKRFHPDRWRARRVLQSVEDEELKSCLEVAANTVAQALTPIWRESRKP